MRYAALAGLLWLGACFADGKEIIGPRDPDYAAVCVDSTATDPDRVCWARHRIGVLIPNPLLPDTTSQ